MIATTSRVSRKIPLVDLNAAHEELGEELDHAVQRIIRNGAFVGGAEVMAFADEFADYCETDFAVPVGNGTDALTIALRGLGIGPGDEVITSPLSFIATAEAIALCGAVPVFCDIDPETYNIDPNKIEDQITYRTKAIVPVHLYGQPAEMGPILEIARSHGLFVVEDAAQAHGAEYRGRPVGSLGDAAAFSFYPGKNLGAYGDAGALVTSNEELADFARRYADHGRQTKYTHEFVGTNSRMDGLHAAVLRVKLRHLDSWNRGRTTIAEQYRNNLIDAPGIHIADELSDRSHAYHLFVVEVHQREQILESLRDSGIGAGVHYPVPLHLQPAFEHLQFETGMFPHAERASDQVMSLPMYPQLESEQVDFICESVRETVATGGLRYRA